MKISIIVPLFNRQDLTAKFIQQMGIYLNKDTELIFVDNNSTDNTLSLLNGVKKNYGSRFPIKILSLPENIGFGGANNRGVELSNSEIVLFISNDVEILGDVISPVVDELSKKDRLAVGPRLLTYDTGWNNFTRFGIIKYLEGFCFAVRKTEFQMVGGFDENIFIDCEDMELCLRLHLAGIGLKQIALPVMHQLGQSFGGLNSARLDYTLRSLAYMEKKWDMKRITK